MLETTGLNNKYPWSVSVILEILNIFYINHNNFANSLEHSRWEEVVFYLHISFSVYKRKSSK